MATKIDTTEFAEFYRLNFDRIAGQLHAYLGDHAEAQDITQEAFCRALDRWEAVSRYERPASWVRHVAWNLATSRLRHVQVTLRHLSRQRLEHVDGPSPDRVALTHALSMLSPNHRLAVVLHYLGHQSAAEIAEDRGVAEGTVRSWLSRGRAQLAYHLADEPGPQLAALARTGFQPEGAQAAAKSVGRRRVARRAVLATIIIALLAVPLLVLLNARRDIPPPVQPPPSPVVTTSPSPVAVSVKTVALPGVAFTSLPDLYYVDSRQMWLSYQVADGPVVLGVTADGGVTWRQVPAPALPPPGEWYLSAFSADRAMLVVGQRGQERFLLTDNGGATFTPYQVNAMPEWARKVEGGLYRMVCPGSNGLEPPSYCAHPELIKIGEGKVSPQPPLGGGSAAVLNGSDGQLWIMATIVSTGVQRLLRSTDNAATWQELPLPPPSSAGPYVPALSRDGRELWLYRGSTFMYRVGEEWHVALDPAALDGVGGLQSWAPIGHETAVVAYSGQVAFVTNGVLQPVPGIGAEETLLVWVLEDGTILLRQRDPQRGGPRTLLGIGSGTQRQWVQFAF